MNDEPTGCDVTVAETKKPAYRGLSFMPMIADENPQGGQVQ